MRIFFKDKKITVHLETVLHIVEYFPRQRSAIIMGRLYLKRDFNDKNAFC